MSYFLSEKPLQANTPVTIKGEEARHLLLSRRMSVGETIEIQGPDFERWECTVTEVNKHTITVTPQKTLSIPPEPKLAITLFQAFTGEQALDYIIQKATELGAHTINIFPSQFSHRVPRQAELTKKLARWNKITTEAAKQSGRRNGAAINWKESIEETIAEATNNDINFVLHPYDSVPLTTYTPTKTLDSVGVYIGPEGGFTNEEVKTLTTNPSIISVQLGQRILRADTAASTAVSAIQTLWGDFRK